MLDIMDNKQIFRSHLDNVKGGNWPLAQRAFWELKRIKKISCPM